MDSGASRYHNAVVALHWVMGAALLAMLASGLSAEYLPLEKMTKFTLVQWHKALGVLMLLAFFLRLALRLACGAPAPHARFAAWERHAARAGHAGLYAVMLLMPVSGWIMVSASPYGLPTSVFGWFDWPHLPGLEGRDDLRQAARQAHTIFAFAFLALLTAHIGAVVKHALCDRVNLLPRMWFHK